MSDAVDVVIVLIFLMMSTAVMWAAQEVAKL